MDVITNYITVIINYRRNAKRHEVVKIFFFIHPTDNKLEEKNPLKGQFYHGIIQN